MSIIGTLFSYILDFLYNLTENFGLSLILFTFFTRIVIFPFSYLSHVNSITLFRIQPQLNDLKAYHSGELDMLIKEQKALYKKEKYSTLKGLLPLAIQLFLVIGIIGAVNIAISGNKYDFSFFAFDLSVTPGIRSIYAVFPVLSAMSSFLLCFIQNRVNPLTKTQGFTGRWGTTIFLTLFSGYFALVCQSGVGLYWITGNLFSIAVTYICLLIYNPKKYADLSAIMPVSKPGKNEKRMLRERKNNEKIREKSDITKFYNAKKELVFYSEANGYYKYFKHFVEFILNNSDITVHYVTSDINDNVFTFNHPRFMPYFCGANSLITLMMKIDADIVVTSLPDLEKYHIKRSLVKKDIEYIYTDHGFGSVNFTLKKGALDHYDTIFCCGKNYNEEITAMEKKYNLPPKNLVNTGFGLYDSLLAEYANLGNETDTGKSKPHILIAPSWQKDNILTYCLDGLLNGLLPGDFTVTLRPHPEFIKRFPQKMNLIADKYNTAGNLEIQRDFSSNSSVYLSDIVITDWSTIAQEFSFITKKPSLFINTPMKVMNPDWEEIGVEPIDFRLRNTIGKSIDTDELKNIKDIIIEMIDNTDLYKEQITKELHDCIYNIGHSAQVGGQYIIDRIEQKRGIKQ